MKVSDFKDKHKGEIAFILGAGPSLHYVDIDLIKDHVCIAVNSGIVKYPDCNFFISDDYDCCRWSYYRDIIKKSSCIKFLYDKKFKNKCDDLEKVVLFDHKCFFAPENKSYNFDGLKLKDEEPLIGARVSTASALHIAYIMGADPIVLLGNDCQLSEEKKYRYFWQYYDKKEQPYRTDGRDFSQTQNRGFNKDSFVEYWNYFADVNKDSNVNIIDASDSCLDCFPKMSVKEILNKYGER